MRHGTSREMLFKALEEKFGIVSASLISRIKSIEEPEVLKSLLKAAINAQSLDRSKEVLKQIEK